MASSEPEYDSISAQYSAVKKTQVGNIIECYTVYKCILPSLLGDSGLLTGKRILDLGCGEGRHTRQLKALGCDYILGVDLSSKVIELAREAERFNPLGIEYLVGDAKQLPPPEQLFDLVTAFFLFPHAQTRAELLDMVRTIYSQLGENKHFIGATQTLIKQGVLTCRSKCSIDNTNKSNLLHPKHQQVTVECPVRLDLSGGWTDTPPICYEHGGSVLNVAITINGQRPVGARARLIESTTSIPFVTFILKGEHEKDDKIYELHQLVQFTDYNQPQRPCALLKTCCIFTGIIDINATQEMTLNEQLKKNLSGYSLILEAWSNVPVGSGLGTSSILAGAILLALWNLIGIENITDSTIIHGVLVVEQMMTTGGGWQDQIGGLLPAFKLGKSNAQLPLEVNWRQLNVKDNNNTIFWNDFDERLILVYTGQTRLARNLLQCVLRNWYSGTISQLFDELEENAIRAAEAVEQGNLSKLGECMSIYWQQKLRVAPGSEPEICRRLIDLLTPYIYGITLAGAGGGGFLAALAKTTDDARKCRELINQENIPNVSLFSAQIDRHGPVISFS
ncbi:unnamed protein product [Rotaria sordida]|uniref:Uncharacterized protein n=2 Tax=Rotaria sordida TaxID=392033 RepID=A0A813W654_9BILA|nr:unnamed protein product [Rotaria sordida]